MSAAPRSPMMPGIVALGAGLLGFAMGRIDRAPELAKPAPRPVGFTATSLRSAPVPAVASAPAEGDESEAESQEPPVPLGADDSAEAIVARFQTLPGSRARGEEIDRILSHLAEHDLPRALAVIEGLTNQRLRGDAVNALLGRWAKSDPDAATAYVLALPPGRVRRGALGHLLGKLADSDGARAGRLFQELPPRDENDSLGLNFGVSWGGKDPAGAAEFFLEHGNKFDHLHTLQHIIMHWADRDHDAALMWAAALPPSEAQSRAVENVVRNIASADPEKAAAFLATLPLEDAEKLAGTIASGWAGHDPAMALAWASHLPSEKARTVATESIVRSWADDDPVAVAGWLNRLAPGNVRDEAVGVYANSVDDLDPEGAAAWALTIRDDARRAGAVRSVWGAVEAE